MIKWIRWNNFFYYDLSTPDYNGSRMIHIRLLGRCLLYKRNIRKNCWFDRIMLRIRGEPLY